MSLLQAVLLTVVVLVLGWAEMWFAFPMICSPLVLGPVVGLILGDPVTGVLCGAACQIFFLASVGLGGTTPPDGNTGTVLGTAFAIVMGQGPEVAVVIGTLASYIGQFFFYLSTQLKSGDNRKIERYIREGNDKALIRLHWRSALLPMLPGAAANFILFYFGTMFIGGWGAYIPDWVITGIHVAIGIVGALSIAQFLRMIWSKELAVYFFLGFLLSAFLHIAPIGVLALGLVLVYFLYQREQRDKAQAALEPSSAAGEEDLFND